MGVRPQRVQRPDERSKASIKPRKPITAKNAPARLAPATINHSQGPMPSSGNIVTRQNRYGKHLGLRLSCGGATTVAEEISYMS